MEQYKRDFIEFLLKTGALGVFENPSDDRDLKSKRKSPWFVNIGEFNDGESTSALAGFYADAIISSGVKSDILYGIPDKGVALSPPVSMAMASKGHNVGWVFSRKDEKTHGESSNLKPGDRAKKLLVGRIPKEGNRITQLDDVFTAGNAKYEARDFLNSLGKFEFPLLGIAVDRQEVAIDSRDAIAEYQEKTGTRVVSVVNAVDVYNYLKETGKASPKALERLARYIRVYGTQTAKAELGLGPLEQKLIETDRSIIPACDVESLDDFERLVEETSNVPGIGGYKVGFELGLGHGLPKVVEAARRYTKKPIIYDHQKAGTDIPDTGKNFAKVCKKAGIDAVIFFPQAGPETERAWIYYALEQGLKVIVGGRMTHPAYTVSEGGFITDEGALDMYRIAARAGVDHFVVPGNKVDVIKQVRELVQQEGIPNPVFMAPGFVAQGGKIEAGAKAAGERFHGIVGRGIYAAPDMKQAAIDHSSQL